MIDFHALAAAVHLLGGSWQPWLVVLPGLLIGLAVHAVPGLTTSMALAVCLPLIPYMDFLQALIFMTAMYAGALFGVAIPAVLLSVPGSAAAVGTTDEIEIKAPSSLAPKLFKCDAATCGSLVA